MGNCCSFVNERKCEAQKTVSLMNSKLTPNIDYDNTPLNQILTIIIKRYNNSPLLTLKKISLEQIWNILKTYKENASFPIKDYIFFDLRPPNDQKELFLKAFIQLPYTENDLELITGAHEQSLKKYLENKNLILLIPEDKKNSIENIIKQMINRHISMKLCFINNSMNASSLNSTLRELYALFDKKYFIDLPYILFSLNHSAKFSNEGMIFYKEVDYANAQNPSVFKYCNDFVSDSSYWMKADKTVHPVKSFFDSFAIGTILLVSKESSDSKCNNQIDKKHVAYSNNPHMASISTITLSLQDFYDNSALLNKQLNKLKDTLESNKHSLFIQIDNRMAQKDIITVLLIALWKITDMALFKLLLYAEENFTFIDQAKEILHQDSKRLNNLFAQLGYQSEYIEIQKESKYEDLKLLEDKLLFLMKEMLKEMFNNKETFKSTSDIMEKVLENIIKHPNDEKYYKIKKSSKAFRKIIKYKSGREIVALLGFQLEGDFFIMKKRDNVSYIKGQYFDYVKSAKKYLNL